MEFRIVKTTGREEIIEGLIWELDELYETLSLLLFAEHKDESEIKCTNLKIAIRESTLKAIFII